MTWDHPRGQDPVLMASAACAAATPAILTVGVVSGYFIGRLSLSAVMVALARFARAHGLAPVIFDAISIDVTNPAFLWLGATS